MESSKSTTTRSAQTVRARLSRLFSTLAQQGTEQAEITQPMAYVILPLVAVALTLERRHSVRHHGQPAKLSQKQKHRQHRLIRWARLHQFRR